MSGHADPGLARAHRPDLKDSSIPGTDEVTQAAATKGLDELEQLTTSHAGASAKKAARKALQQRDPEERLQAVEALVSDLGEISAILTTVVSGASEEQRREAVAHPFGPAWVADVTRRMRVAEAMAPDGAETGAAALSVGLVAWSEALAASRWEVAQSVLGTLPSHGTDELPAALARVADALQDQDITRAAVMTNAALGASAALPPVVELRLRVVAARCAAWLGRDLTAAGPSVERAMTLARGLAREPGWSDRLGLVAAASAQLSLAAGQVDLAASTVNEATDQGAQSVDLIVVSGQVAAAKGDFALATDRYDLAVARFGDEALAGHLLATVPANLVWRAARRRALTDPAAGLRLFDRALEGGLVGSESLPERRVLAEQAELLDQLGRSIPAAESYFKAAEAYLAGSEAGDAVRLYDRARQLVPDHVGYQCAYAEGLRVSVSGTASGDWRDTLRAADRVLSDAVDGSETPAWALVTAALVAAELGEDDRANLLMERGLARVGGDAMAGFLLAMRRGQGFPAEAVDDVSVEAVVALGDLWVARQLQAALEEAGHPEQALTLAERYQDRWGPSGDLVAQLASMRLHEADAQAVLALLADEAEPSLEMEIIRACAHALRGDRAAEGDVWARVQANSAEAIHERTWPWILFRTGDLDGAVDGYQRLDEGPDGNRDSSVRLDLGEIRMARGREETGDLVEGERLIRETMATRAQFSEIAQLVDVEFAALTREAAGRPHEAALLAAVERLRVQGHERMAELRSRRQPAETVAGQLAAARRALAADEPDAAYRRYQHVVAEGGPAEATLGLHRAAERILDEGDAELASDNRQAAEAAWRRLDRLAQEQPPAGVDDLAARARARLALAELDGRAVSTDGSDGPSAEGGWLDCPVPALGEAFTLFAREPGPLWAHYDDVRRMAGDGRLDPEVVAQLRDWMPIQQIYQLDDVDGLRSAVPSAINLVFGPGNLDLADAVVMDRAVKGLRSRVTEEAGVRFPGVRVTRSPDVTPGQIRLLVYGEVVLEGTVDPGLDQGVRAEAATGELREVVLNHLYRFVTNDDVELWAIGWGDDDQAEPIPLPTDPAARLRLAHVLRALLREGIPIARRSEIIDGFNEAERTGLATLVQSLGRIRPRLYPEILGPYADQPPRSLPAHLEARLTGGGSDSGGALASWTLSRSEATSLAAAAREWRASGPEAAISVRTPVDRLALWRLLAGVRPRIFVVSADELP